MRRKQEAPFCIQVEPTEGCNLYCEFCGLRGIREQKVKNFKFMTVKTAERIASEIARVGWNSRIEFAMHGEPTMNPKIVEIIAVFRKHLPKNQLMITSNGGGLLKDTANTIDRLMRAGLNVLALDWYEDVKIVPKVIANLEKGCATYPVLYYPDNLDNSPHKRWSRNTHVVVAIRDISSETKGTHANLNNHCGGGSPVDESYNYGYKCAKVFRELSFRWNGRVSICCNDFRGVSKFGDILKEPIDTLWNNALFHAARKHLYHGVRTFAPCRGCTAKSYRVGLLPDKKGKLSMPKPTSADKKMLDKAAAGRSLTVKVLRDWEK